MTIRPDVDMVGDFNTAATGLQHRQPADEHIVAELNILVSGTTEGESGEIVDHCIVADLDISGRPDADVVPENDPSPDPGKQRWKQQFTQRKSEHALNRIEQYGANFEIEKEANASVADNEILILVEKGTITVLNLSLIHI